MNLKKLPYFTSLKEALTSFFEMDIGIVRVDRIAGGDTNKAYELTLSNGRSVFVKLNAKDNMDFFAAEAAGLEAIAQTGAIRTPYVFCVGMDESREKYSFLLLEYISGRDCIEDYWEKFAQELATMHQASTEGLVEDGRYGLSYDNYIGARKQLNTACDSWVDFFRDYRLRPQFAHATRYFDTADLKGIDTLLARLDDFLVEPERPSLLHGDLWSGNVIAGNDGKAWLIDPAIYVGHAEADIAMTELFGGFPQRFYDAYREVAPLQPGYSRRCDLYNLYQLLNHLNMFGRGYLPSVRRILKEYVS